MNSLKKQLKLSNSPEAILGIKEDCYLIRRWQRETDEQPLLDIEHPSDILWDRGEAVSLVSLLT